MPTEIQRGELVDRLRRFLGITGRLPLQLDENVVPVVVGENLEGQPYRLAARAFGNVAEVSAAVGFPSQVALTLPLDPGKTRPSQPGAVVVKQVRLENPGAAAAIFTLKISFNLTGTWGSSPGNCFDFDRFHDENGTQRRTPVAYRVNNGIAGVGVQIFLVTIPATGQYNFDFAGGGIVLGPGSELVASGPANVITRAWMYGDFYPDVLL